MIRSLQSLKVTCTPISPFLMIFLSHTHLLVGLLCVQLCSFVSGRMSVPCVSSESCIGNTARLSKIATRAIIKSTSSSSSSCLFAHARASLYLPTVWLRAQNRLPGLNHSLIYPPPLEKVRFLKSGFRFLIPALAARLLSPSAIRPVRRNPHRVGDRLRLHLRRQLGARLALRRRPHGRPSRLPGKPLSGRSHFPAPEQLLIPCSLQISPELLRAGQYAFALVVIAIPCVLLAHTNAKLARHVGYSTLPTEANELIAGYASLRSRLS